MEGMSQAAKVLRASAFVELEEAIRQEKRYLGSHQPSTRIIQQKIFKVREKETEFKRYHFAHCEKTHIDVDSQEAMDYLRPKLDDAMDIIDECTTFIEEREMKKQEEDDQSSAESKEQEVAHRFDTISTLSDGTVDR